MRWPFFFGRAAAAKGPQTPGPRPMRREWASLPVIQRAGGEPELTAATAAFVRSLAGTHDPDLSLEPLGHHISLEGPSGLVTGLARSVDTYSPSSEMVGRPRPRRDTTVQARILAAEDSSATAAVEYALGDQLTDPAMMSFAAIDEPVQVGKPLTRMADPEASAVLGFAMPRSVAAEPATPVNEPVRAKPGTEPAAPPVTAQRLTLGQTRRLGLGAPLSQQRATTVQRSVETPALDLAPPAPAVRPDHADTGPEPESRAVAAEGDEIPGPAFERIARISGGTIQRAGAPDAGVAEPAGELPLAGPAAAAVKAGPALEHAVIQRVVATPLPPIYSRPAPPPTVPIASERPPLLTVRRAPGSAEAPADSIGPVEVQRLPVALQGEAPAVTRAFELPPSLAPVGFREVVSAVAPPPSVRPMPPLAPPAPAVQRVGHIAQDFVAFSPFATAPPPLPAQRATSFIEGPAVQREVTAGEAPAPAPGEASAPVVAGSAGAGPAAGESPGRSDKDLDELGRKLYDRISLQLRRDLLIQRERAGMVTDLR
jgi:hypothetical protein